MEKGRTIKLRNPFVYQGYVSPDYFCDRITETKELIANLQNGRNTVLISPRRMGKTGLIQNAFWQLKKAEKNVICIYMTPFIISHDNLNYPYTMHACQINNVYICNRYWGRNSEPQMQ